MDYQFKYSERLGIELPVFYQEWEKITKEQQQTILFKWENVRAQIPDRIMELEHEIDWREKQLQIEDNFQIFCQLSAEIADMASRIIDLNLWFRTQEEITREKVHQ